MITQLYIERVADGVYDVVCNGLVTTVEARPVANSTWLDDITGIGGAIEVLTEPHYDDAECLDDMAGVRVGYKPLDLLGVAYGGEVRIVPAFQLLRTIERLTAVAE